MDQTPSPTIQGYQVEELIGEGAYGAVYRARQQAVDRQVAVKIILPEFANRPRFIRRFEAEAQLIAQLEHLHIVPLYDYWRDHQGAYLVMRLMKGGSLEQLIQKGPLPLSRVYQIMEQVASALSAAHQRGIVHRDIKPANILLDEDGNSYLSDFGIAKALGEDSGQTMTGAIIGTPAYITPEQVQSLPISPQTDIYALGVLLFTLLTGEHPFPLASSGDLIAHHLRDPLPIVHEVDPGIPAGLNDVIQKATAKDPDNRFSDVEDLFVAYSQAVDLEKTKSLVECEPLERVVDGDVSWDQPPDDLNLRPPHNLPSDLTAFVGRESEQKALQEMFADPKVRLVTILGGGGMGKTRLAMAFAESQLDVTIRTNGSVKPIYPHGIFFIPLAPLQSSDSIVPTVAGNLGFRLSEKRDPHNQLIDYLDQKELLLIFDNYEHLLDGTMLVVEILKSVPKAKVLATSRTRLNIGGEHRFKLKGMDLPNGVLRSTDEALAHSSIELFRQSACRAQADFVLGDDNLNDVAQICKLLEGIPLAIRLAATWVDLLSPGEIIKEIESGLDLLETEVDDMPERHSSMRAVFDHSWSQLTERESGVLGGLSVFRGGFTRDAAEQIAGASLKELKTLVNKSLVNPTVNQRFEIHELLRQYISGKLVDFPERNEKVKDLHCEYYMKFLELCDEGLRGGRQLEVLGEIEDESGNVQLAWNYAVEKGKVDCLYQALDGLCRFYLWRRRFHEGRAACWEAELKLTAKPSGPLLDADDAEKQKLLARILTWHSVFCEHSVAKENIEKALAVLDRPELVDADIRREKAFALQELGDLTIDFDCDQAEHLYEKSLQLFRLVEDDYGVAQVMTSLGWVSAHQGELDQAKKWGESSLALQKLIGDRKGIADSLWMLGTNAIINDEIEESVELISESLEIRKCMGDRLIDIASGSVDLGMTLTWIGRMEEAKEVRQETLAIYQDQGNDEEIALAHSRLAFAYLHLGDYEALRRSAETGYSIGKQVRNQRAVGLALFMLGAYYFVYDQFDTARKLLEEGLSIFRIIPGAGELGWILGGLALNEYQRGEHNKALKFILDALSTGRGLLATITAWSTIPVYVCTLIDAGEHERAIEIYACLSRYPLVFESQLYKDLYDPKISFAVSRLPKETVDQARSRGRARILTEIITEIIKELENALDE